jgi:Fic family protein
MATTVLQEDEALRLCLAESNAIEGVYSDTALDDAIATFKWLMEQEQMTPAVVKKAHYLLFTHPELCSPEHRPLARNEIGYFRTISVYIGAKPALKATKIPKELVAWCAAMNSKNPTHDWKELHVLYERIHPFVDGNGRTGRMFMNWHRIKILGLPLLTVWEDKRFEYYRWFK